MRGQAHPDWRPLEGRSRILRPYSRRRCRSPPSAGGDLESNSRFDRSETRRDPAPVLPRVTASRSIPRRRAEMEAPAERLRPTEYYRSYRDSPAGSPPPRCPHSGKPPRGTQNRVP